MFLFDSPHLGIWIVRAWGSEARLPFECLRFGGMMEKRPSDIFGLGFRLWGLGVHFGRHEGGNMSRFTAQEHPIISITFHSVVEGEGVGLG